MNARATRTRSGEAGFLLLEAVIAVALIAVCACAALAAAAAVTRATSQALPTAALTVTAQNVLTDLRAATAYDPDGLAALAGKSTAFDVVEPSPDGSPRTIHISLTVSRPAAAARYIGTVIARSSGGAVVRLEAVLAPEAPAPGAIVPAIAPAAAPGPPAAGGDGPEPIAL